MKRAELICGDSLEMMRDFDDGTFTSVVSDPPYGLKFLSAHWDHGIPGAEYWAEALRVSRPGSPLLAFGGTRTFHRLTCAIEDAGWEIRDCLMFLYGSGFPKSHKISKALDKRFADKPRPVVGMGRSGKTAAFSGLSGGSVSGEYAETLSVSEQAKLWDGYGSSLKPAWEPIILAMNPLDGTFADNALKHGVAGLSIDGCRVGCVRMPYVERAQDKTNAVLFGSRGGSRAVGGTMLGRWPANFILSHTERCKVIGYKTVDGRTINRLKDGAKPFGGGAGHDYETQEFPPESVPVYECSDDCPVKMLDDQAGDCPTGKLTPACKLRASHDVCMSGQNYERRPNRSWGGENGGPSRFFYTSKASKKERKSYNNHPTVKPLAIMRYLCRLVKMPQENLILDPFCGSGSTLIAAGLEGMNSVGIDLERDHIRIAQRRLEDFGVNPRFGPVYGPMDFPL